MGSEEPNGPVLTFGGEYGLMLDNRAPLKADIHPYQAVPHTLTEITRMRMLGKLDPPGRKIVISEIGTAAPPTCRVSCVTSNSGVPNMRPT